MVIERDSQGANKYYGYVSTDVYLKSSYNDDCKWDSSGEDYAYAGCYKNVHVGRSYSELKILHIDVILQNQSPLDDVRRRLRY